MPTLGAALLVGLLPAQSFALPPDPATAEKGRETLKLETLDQDEIVAGAVSEPDLETLKVDVAPGPAAGPDGHDHHTAAGTEPVDFGSAASTAPASARMTAAAQQVGMTPAGNLPISLGQAPDQAAPTGTWQVQRLRPRGRRVRRASTAQS